MAKDDDDDILNIELEDLDSADDGGYPRIEPGADLEEALGRKGPGLEIDCVCSVQVRWFTVRFEQAGPQHYEAVAATAVADKGEASVPRPGRARTEGRFGLKSYPGCPYCGSRALAVCDCGAVICEGAVRRSLLGTSNLLCPVCRSSAVLSGAAHSVTGRGGGKGKGG